MQKSDRSNGLLTDMFTVLACAAWALALFSRSGGKANMLTARGKAERRLRRRFPGAVVFEELTVARSRLALLGEHGRLGEDWPAMAAARSSLQHPFTSHV